MLHVADWWQVIFNPSFPYRFAHMVAAAYLTTAFIVAGIGAWYILRERSVPHGRIMLGMGLSLSCGSRRSSSSSAICTG